LGISKHTSMNTINKEWHVKNKMPQNPTIKERILWHTGHAKHCSCRDSKPHLLKLKKVARQVEELRGARCHTSGH